MPKSFIEVQDEYDQFKTSHPDDTTPLHDFAKQMDEVQGTPGERADAYNDAWYKKASAGVDRAFRATQIPQLVGQATGGLGGLIDSGLGTHVEPTMQHLGEDLPRALVESIATIPAGPVGEGAVWIPRLRALAKVAGYAGTGLSGYAQTQSPVGAAINMGTMGAMNKLLLPTELGGKAVGEQAANAIRDRLGIGQAIEGSAGRDLSAEAPDLVRSNPMLQSVLPAAGAAAAEAGTVTGLNELSRQASLSVGPNAQPLSSPGRNPLTPENIVGAVANAVPFAGQAALGLRNASGFDPRAVKGMHDWIENRRQAVEADATGAVEGDVPAQASVDATGKVPPEAQPEFDLPAELAKDTPKFTPDEQKTLVASIRSQLDTAKMARMEGATGDADMLYGKAKAMMDMGAVSEGDVPAAAKASQMVDTEARQMPAQTPEGLTGFVQKVNSLIDFWNENRTKFQPVLETDLPEPPVVRDAQSLKTYQEVVAERRRLGEEQSTIRDSLGGPRQAWSPNAVAPEVVQRLQGKGLLPKIDSTWLKNEWNATFDDTGSPQFATDVLSQKVANHLLDNVPEALKQEASIPQQVTTPVSPQVAKVNSQEAQFFDALSQFSGATQEALIGQTLKFRRSPDQFFQGRQLNPYDSWQRAVITAAQTFDPASQTVQMYKNGRMVKTTINELWSKDFQPVLTPVKAGAGGKGKVTLGGKTIPEGNLEAMVAPESVGGTPDEEQLSAQLAESGGEGLAGMKQLGTEPASAEESLTSATAKPVEENLVADVPKAQSDKFLKQAEQYRKIVDSLSPDQAWRLVRGIFTNKRASALDEFRAANAKTALQAVAEQHGTARGEDLGPASKTLIDAYKASGGNPPGTPKKQLGVILHSFFGSTVPADESVAMTTTARGDRAVADRQANLLAWMRKATERVLDPRAVEAAKTYSGPRAMPDQRFPVGSTIKWANGITSLAKENAPVRFESENGQKALVTREPAEGQLDFKGQNSGPWRLTYFDQEMHPVGHETYNTWKDAYTSIGTRSSEEKQTSWHETKFDPQALQVPGVEDGSPEDLLVNHPKPGDFQPDVLRTLQDRFSKALGAKGYSGSLRDLATNMGMAIARQAADPTNTDFYRISQGPRGLAWDTEGRGKVGLNVDSPVQQPGAERWVHDVLNTFTHELAHVDDFIAHGMLDKPDAFSEERARQLRNLQSLGKTLDPQSRDLLLSTLRSGLRPDTYESVGKEKTTGLTYGSSDPREFSAVIMSLVTQSLLFGKEKGLKNAMNVLDYSPTEVSEFAQGTYRHIRDVMDALKETIANPDVRSAVPISDNVNRYINSEAFDAVVQGARYASKVRDGAKEVKAAQDYIETMSGKLPTGVTDAMWFKRQEDTSKYMPGLLSGKSGPLMKDAVDAIGQGVEALGVRYGKEHELSAFTKWFAPFSNKMDMWKRKGVETAGPLANLIIDTEGAIHRTRSDILKAWLKKKPDGSVEWNVNNPFIGAAGKDPALHKAFNEVSQWQHDNQGTTKIGDETYPTMEPMFVVGQDGTVQANPNHPKNAIAAWAEMSKNMSNDTMQKVMAGSVAADQTHQIMAARTTGFMSESATIRVARMLQVFDPTLKSTDAYAQAHDIFAAAQSGDVASAVGTRPPEQQQAIASFLKGPLDNIQRFENLSQARPGMRTESLPGQYIIMYKNKDGEVKFTSAPDEYRAKYVMKKVEAQGNTLIGENPKNRNDLRGSFQDFDSPEAVIERAAYLENESWKTAVDQIRATQGDQVADELMKSYTPMTTSLKDVTSQGFRKFFEKADSKVDPENLDYLDAMFARSSRLSASGVYHVNSAMKDLLLNDPRARMFPSLGQAVREQWDHVTSPTDDTTKKLKGLTAGYYMGGSLGNAIMELSQGVSSFVPRMVSTNNEGGFAKGYSQFFSAIGQTAGMALDKNWQRLAAVGERKDAASLSPDETRAVMMKRATESGVIGHNILGEIFSSRDLQIQQKQKFGEGDYGPRSMTDLATNGLYVGAQVMTGLYSWAARSNDRIAFLMGVNQGMEQGLSGDALYNHARNFHQLVQGGGKADAPGMVAKFAGADPKIRSAVGLVYTLQHYGTKMVATYAQLGSEAISNSTALSPLQRVQARKAFLGFLATQTALAGALGMPFAGAALTILEDQFGVPVKETVRKTLASLGSGDEDSWASGQNVADVALNGVANHVLGLDVSSRLGVSNLFGTSSYHGFNLADMFGPAPSIVENAAKSLNYFGQGEPMKAAKELVPQAFKNIVTMADSQQKYGDLAIRDAGDALLYKPTDNQSVGYALGFRPRESSQKQQALEILSSLNKREQSSLGRQQSDLAAKLLVGDGGAAQQYAQELHYHDPTVGVDDTLRAILEKAVEASTEKDLLASGPKSNAQERSDVMSTFGSEVNPRQSEVGLNQLRTQLAARLGSPALIPDGSSWSKAAIVDGMVQQSGGKMARSQALALVRMMGL